MDLRSRIGGEKKNYMCLNETRLCAQNMLTVQSSVINMIGTKNTCNHLMSMKSNFHFDNEEVDVETKVFK